MERETKPYATTHTAFRNKEIDCVPSSFWLKVIL